jgi:tRNA(Ile)-lysidine synthase TilS/MesJ
LVVIRPLAYVSEKEIALYAREADFPPLPPPCPVGSQSKRALMRQVVQTIEETNPRVRIHLWRAVQQCQTQTTERT